MKSVNDVSEQVSTLSPVQIALGGGGPFLLASVASLEKRGEGVTLADWTTSLGARLGRVTPSPFASKLATLAKSLTGNESE